MKLFFRSFSRTPLLFPPMCLCALFFYGYFFIWGVWDFLPGCGSSKDYPGAPWCFRLFPWFYFPLLAAISISGAAAISPMACWFLRPCCRVCRTDTLRPSPTGPFSPLSVALITFRWIEGGPLLSGSFPVREDRRVAL